MRKRRYASPPEKLTDAESYFLQGPVKLVMETCYKAHADNGKTVQGKIEAEGYYNETNYITAFNEQGMRVSETCYGATDYKQSLFDAAGRETESETSYNGKTNNKTQNITCCIKQLNWKTKLVMKNSAANLEWQKHVAIIY